MKIRAKKDLYNNGLCFAKGEEYDIPTPVSNKAALMDCRVINRLGEPHFIGRWWKEFDLVEDGDDSTEAE